MIALEPDLTIEPSDFSTMLASPPFLLPGVVLALRSAPPRAQISIVPGHLAHQRAADVLVDGATRQQLDGVAHFGDFGEHHGRAGAHQKVGGEADRGIGGDAGKCVAAAALQADHEIGRPGRSRAGAG